MSGVVKSFMYGTFVSDKINSGNIMQTIDETISYYWPKNMSKPNLCYFDNRVGPIISKFTPESLGLEEKIEKNLVENSMADDSCETPMSIKIYRDELLISYAFKIRNKKERGGYSMCSVISRVPKNKFNLEFAEKEVSYFVSEIEKVLDELVVNGGAVA